MITIRSLIAGLISTLLAVISIATFLLVYFASLDSVESLTALSVQTASDRIAGQISTTLLDRVTNPLVAVARAARVRSFTAPADDPFTANATSPDRFAWHGEWRTLFADIVSGCPSCTMNMRFIDGSYAISFPVPGQGFRYHQFARSDKGTHLTDPETFYDHRTYKLVLQTFDESVVTGVTEYKPTLATRVGSTFWKSTVGRIQQQNLALPQSVPGVWTSADLTPQIPFLGATTQEVSVRCDMIMANSTDDIALISVYVPLRDVTSAAEASVSTPNSRVFVVNELGVVTELRRAADILAKVIVNRCSAPASPGCLPQVSTLNFQPLQIAVNDASFLNSCPSVGDNDNSGRPVRHASTNIESDDGDVYFASTRCVDTPLSLSRLRVVSFIPQNDINQDLTTGRDISIAIVIVFFFISLVFGYYFVWIVLKPFEVIAQRMKKAALLADNEPKSDGSCLEEISRLQLAYETMNDELLRLKGFIPQSVLQLDLTDSGSLGSGKLGEDGRMYHEDGTAMVDMVGGAAAAGMAGASTRPSGADLFRRAHVMAERLSVSVASTQRNHVAVCVINLRNFHGTIADMTTEDLSLAVKQIVRIISDVTADNRGVVDFFHGDHYILTYNAARICHSPTNSAISTSLKVTQALVNDPVVGQMARLGVPYISPSSSSGGSGVGGIGNNSGLTGGGDNDNNNNGSGSPPAGGYNTSGGNSSTFGGSSGSGGGGGAGGSGPRLILSAGISAGEATVGSFGSTELKRFCTIGPCYSQAFEIELLLKDAPLLRLSSNRLPHSIGVPNWMFSHVFKQYKLEAITIGSLTKTKSGIARILCSAHAPLGSPSGMDVNFHMLASPASGMTPREGDDAFGTAKPSTPAGAGGGITAHSKECLEAFVDLVQTEDPVEEQKIIAGLKTRDPASAAALDAILTQYSNDVNMSSSALEGAQEEEDVLHDAFASEEDWIEDQGGSGTDTQSEAEGD